MIFGIYCLDQLVLSWTILKYTSLNIIKCRTNTIILKTNIIIFQRNNSNPSKTNNVHVAKISFQFYYTRFVTID